MGAEVCTGSGVPVDGKGASENCRGVDDSAQAVASDGSADGASWSGDSEDCADCVDPAPGSAVAAKKLNCLSDAAICRAGAVDLLSSGM